MTDRNPFDSVSHLKESASKFSTTLIDFETFNIPEKAMESVGKTKAVSSVEAMKKYEEDKDAIESNTYHLDTILEKLQKRIQQLEELKTSAQQVKSIQEGLLKKRVPETYDKQSYYTRESLEKKYDMLKRKIEHTREKDITKKEEQDIYKSKCDLFRFLEGFKQGLASKGQLAKKDEKIINHVKLLLGINDDDDIDTWRVNCQRRTRTRNRSRSRSRERSRSRSRGGRKTKKKR